MRNSLRLYGKYFSILLRSAMQYKASFLLLTAGQFLSSFTALLSIWFLFQRFHTVEGFTFPQVLLCFAAVLAAFSLAECFARGFDTFPQMLANGEFDRVLLRPRNEIFQTLASKMEFSRVGRLCQAALVFCWAVPQSGVAWTFPKALCLALMVLGGAVLFSGLFLLYAGICFFTTEGLEVMNIFTDGGREFGAYPLSVYGKDVLRLCTWVVPLACVQYYPLLFLLGRGPGWYGLLPLAGVLFLLPCWLFWRLGLRRYKSTGS